MHRSFALPNGAYLQMVQSGPEALQLAVALQACQLMKVQVRACTLHIRKYLAESFIQLSLCQVHMHICKPVCQNACVVHQCSANTLCAIDDGGAN